jgi:hypothetical protein
MSRRNASHALRDQHESPFSIILARLCSATGAFAAALVDQEGETVDYAGRFTPYDIRVTAAELQIVLAAMFRSPAENVLAVDQLFVRSGHRAFAMIALTDGYSLVLVLHRSCFRVSRRAVAQAVRELEIEAGLTYVRGSKRRVERWSRVIVRTARKDRRRPEAIEVDGEWCLLTILGRFRSRDLERREVGYRARLPNGAEFALVREPPGRWFAEDL